MSDKTSETLQEAFELIEKDQLAEARELLQPLSTSEANNPAFWWVYAHAVDSEEEGIGALDKVVKLDPTYPGATELKKILTATEEKQEPISDTVDDWDDTVFEPDADSLTQAEKKGGGIFRFALVGIVVIAIIGIIFVLLSNGGDSPVVPTEVANNTQVPTANAQVQTSASPTEAEIVPSITPEILDTPSDVEDSTEIPTETQVEIESSVTPEINNTLVPTQASTVNPTELPEYSNSLVAQLSQFNVTNDDINAETTLLGETIQVEVCALPGAESSIRLNETMDAFISSSSMLPATTEAVAVILVNCDDENVMSRTIGVTKDVLESVANGEIEIKDFQRMWQPLP